MGHTIILGNGISGITAARHIRKHANSEKITVISSETEHFFSRTALMYIYMGHMKYENTKPYEDWFWKKNRIELARKYVESIDFEKKQLHFSDGGKMEYDKLVLAVGSKWNKFGWKGQDLSGVGGLFSYQDLEYLEEHTKNIQRAVIVGGGLIGVELAEMLLSRNIQVTFLVRESVFWGNVLPKEDGELISDHMIEDHHVDLRLSAELEEILDDGKGNVKGVRTKTGETIDCQFVGLTVGVSPNVDFLKDSGIEINKGILVNEFLETNMPDVYAIGDCSEQRNPAPGRRAIEPVWYTGRMMGEVVAKSIAGNKTKYQPGIWFNSAKFFDIEYQTYGSVSGQLQENEVDFIWKNEKKNLLIHVVFEKEGRKLIGINTFGIRLRHELFDQWLREEQTVDYMLEHLKDANFDPEFYHKYEEDILGKFNKEHNTSITSKRKSWSRILKAVTR